MLTPRKIQELSAPIEAIYQRMTDELLINIGKHVRSPSWTHTAAWEVQKLSEIGQLTTENAAIINRWIKDVPKAVRETMEATRAAALDDLERQIEAAASAGHITPPLADSTLSVMRDAMAQAGERYGIVNSSMLESSVEVYAAAVLDVARSSVEDAALAVAAGTKTRTAAIRDALHRMAAEGLTGFVDKAGRTWQPDAYVNMVTRTTVHNVAIQSRRAFGEDYGSDVFQVSSHAGARPGCYPYQGKFYSWGNTSGEIELGDGRRVPYEPINATSYGQPAGLFGINCRHHPIPIVPGVSIPHGADSIQPEDENERLYAETQEQRRLERDIREAKRELAMLGDLATKDDAARLNEAQAAMREFIKATGLPRRRDRERI